MNKLNKLFQFIQAILQKPSLINKVLESNEWQKKLLQKKYNLPNGLTYLRLSNLVKLEDLEIATTFLEGGSMPTDYFLLAGLAKKFGGHYFEIGTWRGESATNLVGFVKSCTTFNLSKEEIIAKGGSQEYADAMGFFVEDEKQVKQVFGNSLTFDFATLGSKYELIFIDGDHHYESVKSDTQQVFQHLANELSIVVWHDYGTSPEQPRWEVLRGILDGLPPEKHKHLYAVTNTLCAIYYPFGANGEEMKFPQPVKEDFELTIYPSKIV